MTCCAAGGMCQWSLHTPSPALLLIEWHQRVAWSSQAHVARTVLHQQSPASQYHTLATVASDPRSRQSSTQRQASCDNALAVKLQQLPSSTTANLAVVRAAVPKKGREERKEKEGSEAKRKEAKRREEKKKEKRERERGRERYIPIKQTACICQGR